MVSRLPQLTLATLALAFALTATALATPAVSGHGASNPIAWGLKSGQWTTIWVKSGTSGAWASVQILSNKGVVKTVYSGPLDSRPKDSAGRLSFPRWNGKDASGHYLATGNYRYRIQLTKGGTASVSGLMAVSKLRFSLSGTYGEPVARYLYAGTARAYYRAQLPPNEMSTVGFAGGPQRTGDNGEPAVRADRTLSNDSSDYVWTPVASTTFSAKASESWIWVFDTFTATWDDAWGDPNGALVELTVMQ